MITPIHLPPNNNLAIYIHWPWCKKKCPYCDFNSHVSSQIPEEQYIDAICTDIKNQAQNIDKAPVSSIFFGGGTPSLMSPQSMEKCLETAYKAFDIDNTCEITSEANPTSSNQQKIKDFKSVGINRLSIGIQSLQDKDLKFLGREHNASEAIKTAEEALNIFDNVNIDLIYGLPGQNLDDWAKQLNWATRLNTQHLSCYQLTIEENTAFHKQVKQNLWNPMNIDLQADFFEFTRETLVSHNYVNYEVSNFAKPSKNCIHNTHIWNYGNYIGIGAGAHGRITKTHTEEQVAQIFATQNYKMPSIYMENIRKNNSAIYRETLVEGKDIIAEKLLMGLRLESGVYIPEVVLENTTEYGIDSLQIKRLISLGMLKYENNFLKLTAKGWAHLDGILELIIT